MNQKLLKILLLSSAMTLSLAACGHGVPSIVPSDDPTSEKPSEDVSSEVVDSQSVEESSSADETPSLRVTLNRNIYVEGEELDIALVENYSKALKGYKEVNNYTVEMPATCPNGEAKAVVTAGNKTVDVPFYYYQDAAAAAANYEISLPANASDYFKETSYIKSNKLQFQITVQNGQLYAAKKNDYTTGGLTNQRSADQTYNTNILNVWNADGCVAATLDPSKITLPHYEEEGAVVTASTYQPLLSGADGTLSNVSSMLGYELIADGDGKICYYAPIVWGEAIDISSQEGYWSYYKDYTQNPAFVLADDYDAESNKSAYEKVLPEGGLWVIGYNNNANSALGAIDTVNQLITGTKTSAYSYRNAMMLTFDDEAVEAAISSARLFYDTVKRNLTVYKAADTYQTYAYYYYLAIQANDPEKLAVRDQVYNAILFQKLPEVANEPVLLSYYEAQTFVLLDSWAEMFAD